MLKRTLEKARERGFTFYVSPEMEYFYFRSSTEPIPLDQASYFDLTPSDEASELRKQTILALENMGIPVQYSHHEIAPSQQEIDLRYTDALTMADNVMAFRMVVKEVAQSRGVYATFMPKPVAGWNGSAMHTHLSLFEGDVNAFHDAGDEYGLSKVAKGFIAGLLHHAKEITAVTNQWVNSYKRLIPGYEAPDLHLLGPQQPLGPGPGADPPPGRVGEPGRVPGPRPGLQPVPGLLAHAGRRAAGHREGLRAAPRGDSTTSTR